MFQKWLWFLCPLSPLLKVYSTTEQREAISSPWLLLLVCKPKYFIRVLQRQFQQKFDTVFGWSVELTDLLRHYNCTTYRGGKCFTHILYVNSKQEFSHIFPWGGVWDTLSTFSMCVCVCVSQECVCVSTANSHLCPLLLLLSFYRASSLKTSNPGYLLSHACVKSCSELTAENTLSADGRSLCPWFIQIGCGRWAYIKQAEWWVNMISLPLFYSQGNTLTVPQKPLCSLTSIQGWLHWVPLNERSLKSTLLTMGCSSLQ